MSGPVPGFMSGPGRHRKTHELKTYPEEFQEVRGGRMKFQFRRKDRDFLVGDELRLKEWEPPEAGETYFDDDFHYTGRSLRVRVDYIMTYKDAAKFDRGFLFFEEGEEEYVIMSISLVS